MNEIESGSSVRIGNTNVMVDEVTRVSLSSESVRVDFTDRIGGRWSIDIYRGKVTGKRAVGWGSNLDTQSDPVVMRDVLSVS